jgi:very-short-patch-repair endonuclease
MKTSHATLLRRAKRMRREQTFNERMLWRLLRDRRLDGLKFRRQVPLGPYIVDFVCLAHHLVVEADGPHHDPAKDALKDRMLGERGFRVLRFENSMITLHADVVLDRIREAVQRTDAPHPTRSAGHLLP